APLQLAQLRGQRGLVADGRRHAAEQGRHLGAREQVAKDVVNEQERVGSLLIAEVLGHRQPGQPNTRPSARRFVHLTEDEGRLGSTPASCISTYMSLPSRVRSPTPANTERPMCW